MTEDAPFDLRTLARKNSLHLSINYALGQIRALGALEPVHTLDETAAVMGLSRGQVFDIERTAFRKLRRDPALRQLARERGYHVEDIIHA
jgi:hypothetical protein